MSFPEMSACIYVMYVREALLSFLSLRPSHSINRWAFIGLIFKIKEVTNQDKHSKFSNIHICQNTKKARSC